MYLPAIYRWRIWTFWASTGTFYKKFRFFISFGKCVSVFSKICNRELYVEKRYAKYLLILCHTQCQIMYKWILKKREYWTKGNILGQFGRQMSGQPMIFSSVQFIFLWRSENISVKQIVRNDLKINVILYKKSI